MDKKKIEVIPLDAIINIDLSGSFYQRLQAVFLYLANMKDQKEFLLHYALITKAKPEELKDQYDISLYTMLILIHEIELAARKDDKIKEVAEEDLKPASES